MSIFRTRAALVIACCLMAACSGPESVTPADEDALLVEKDVVYAQGLTARGSIPLHMDLYRVGETCETPKPRVLNIHGGAFVRGSKESNGWNARAEDAARRGYVAAAIDYRLIPDSPVIADEFEPVWRHLYEAKADLPSNTRPLDVYARGVTAAIEDTVAALLFLEADSPEHRCIDMSRIGIWGGSAGAIAAVHVAYGLDAYRISYPMPDLVISYWGRSFLDGQIQSGDAPIFLLHGRADDRVSVEGSLNLKAEADAAGVGASLYVVEAAAHGYSGISIQGDAQSVRGRSLLELTLDFLDAHLKPDAATPVYETVSIQ